MTSLALSVVIPTHNRPQSLLETLGPLRGQTLPPSSFEVIVVDDGSAPPVRLPVEASPPPVRLVRLEGAGRSHARNAGAAAAQGAVLVFIDDDMTVGPDFLEMHLRAHREWNDALAVGRIRLPESALAHPFGRFRQRLESSGEPAARGPASAAFCAAGNLSVAASAFAALGGFDAGLSSAEDQDLGHRHAARGGTVLFLPEAAAVHRDRALDVRAYGERSEWGSRHLVAFGQLYPHLPESLAREAVNGPARWGRERLSLSLRKTAKAVLGTRPGLGALRGACALLERFAPRSSLLDRLYRLVLGVHLQRGHRRGLRDYARTRVRSA